MLRSRGEFLESLSDGQKGPGNSTQLEEASHIADKGEESIETIEQ